MDAWFKYTRIKLLQKNENIKSHIPETVTFTIANMWNFLYRYKVIIIKPANGSGGAFIIQLTLLPKGKVLLHLNNYKEIVNSNKILDKKMKNLINKRPFIIQRKIPLIKVNNRPVDFRVMVQRKKKEPWTITGKLAKIAGPGYIVTNIHRSKGKVVKAVDAIRQSNLSKKSAEEILAQLDKVSLDTVIQLYKHYPWMKIVGLDIGVDTAGRVWVIESNFNPSLSLFLKLEDKSAYNRIIKFKNQG